MSSTLVWEPKVRPKNEAVDDQIKFIFRKKFGEPVKIKMDNEDIRWLTGLEDADVKGASQLIQGIIEHGTILVYEEF